MKLMDMQIHRLAMRILKRWLKRLATKLIADKATESQAQFAAEQNAIDF